MTQVKQSHWKLRHLYYDRADSALFVRKRSGLGVTLNLANPWAWLLMAAVVGLIVRLALG